MAPVPHPDRHLGCPICRAEGTPANYRCESDPLQIAKIWLQTRPGDGLWRFSPTLPVDDPVSLGEGDTPLVGMDSLGPSFGVERLYAKNEAANPTWSHKDRLAAVTVAVARASGARVVAAASTGNHGAAVAAYAARAGLRCVIATLATVPDSMKRLMVAYGADVVEMATSEDRYELIRQGIDRHGWYPASNIAAPAIGSDPYGITGYKTIAYELVEQLGGAPEWIVMPVAYGDCLTGVAQGFADLHAGGLVEHLPRIVGAELFGALEQGLRGGGLGPVPTHPSAAFSIAGHYTTYQAIAALRFTGGMAVSVHDDEIARARRALAETEGLLVEAAAAAPFAAAATLARSGTFAPTDRVVCLLTSSGMKDLAATDDVQVPAIAPDLDALEAALVARGRLDQDSRAELFGPTRAWGALAPALPDPRPS
jgi:threonine synthase